MNLPKINNNSKIIVLGTSGAGKSTLARKLAKLFDLEDIELDALHWEQNWVEAKTDVFRERISKAIVKKSGFVIHGNYNKVRDLTWKNAEIILWLDYPKSLIMWRVIKRTIMRALFREELWNGNRESFKMSFFSKSSIMLWAYNTYDIRKAQYEKEIENPTFPNLQFYRFKSPKQVELFLSTLKKQT